MLPGSRYLLVRQCTSKGSKLTCHFPILRLQSVNDQAAVAAWQPGKLESVRIFIFSCRLCLSAAALWFLVATAIPGAASIQASPDCVRTVSGDLLDEIRAITDRLPGPDSDGMVVPLAGQLAAWKQLIKASEEGDLTTACSVIRANGFPYHIVRYTDVAYGDRAYLLLKENQPISVGWGTYVINRTGLPRDVVIEVPHPGCEWHTEEQGVELFRQANAYAFFMAGTHRCANTTYSPCDGTTTFCGQEEPYRTSDVAHTMKTMFYAAHQTLLPIGSDTVAVQIHGCSDPSCPDLFVSNGTCSPGDVAQAFYHNARAACQGFSIDLADCTPPECSFVGTTNLQGRYSNGMYLSPDFNPCTEYAPGPSEPEQFLHLEQSAELRHEFACLAAALRMTFPTSFKVYLPLHLDGHTFTGGQLQASHRVWDSTLGESRGGVCSILRSKATSASATRGAEATTSECVRGPR
jgi:hypothetical protein